jgi:hypothetical protein
MSGADPELSRADPLRVVSIEGWEVERTGFESLVYRAGSGEVALRAEHGSDRGDRYVLVHPSGDPVVDERALRAAQLLFEQAYTASRGWRSVGETAVSLDDGTAVEVTDDVVIVRRGDADAEIPVVRRDGRTLELGYSSARYGAWPEDEALDRASAGLDALGYKSTLVPE